MCCKADVLPKRSLSSCSETNCPKLATNSVEQGGVPAAAAAEDEVEPTGDASAGLATRCGGGMVAWIAAALPASAACDKGCGTVNGGGSCAWRAGCMRAAVCRVVVTGTSA